MSQLPMKTSGVVSVRPLQHGELQSRREPRASSTPTVSSPDAGPKRVPLLKLLRFPAVRDRTGLSRSTIWRLERRGEFPKHYRIAPNVVAWVEDDVAGWIEERTAARQSA